MDRFDEQIEIGNTGWIYIGSGCYRNIYNNHILDEDGREFDEKGNMIKDIDGEDLNES